jgi:hypothetical protein
MWDVGNFADFGAVSLNVCDIRTLPHDFEAEPFVALKQSHAVSFSIFVCIRRFPKCILFLCVICEAVAYLYIILTTWE